MLNMFKRHPAVVEEIHNGVSIYKRRVHNHNYVPPVLMFRDRTLPALLQELLREVVTHEDCHILFGDNFTEWRFRKLTQAKEIADFGEIGSTHRRLMVKECINFLARK
jgi:hypothetical protein